MNSDFIVPKIQPDELLAGYRGRIASWNSCNNHREVARELAMLYPSGNQRVDTSTQFIDAAAAVNDVHPAELLKIHTTYILRTSNDLRDPPSVSSKAVLRSQSTMALHSHNKRIWGCGACMHEDLQLLCFSYWRRSHQVPGRVLCPKHGSSLVPIIETQLLPGGPAQSESFIDANRQPVIPLGVESPRSTFAVAILDQMIKAFRRPPHRAAVSAIRRGLKAQGLDPRKRKSLQAAITEHFSLLWLEGIAGEAGSRPQTISKKIKRVLNPALPCPATDLAILASLAFTDLEEAFAALGLQAEQPNCHLN